MMDRETRQSSRLFAVDVGLDREALRQRFQDRGRYAIVRGQVRPTLLREGKGNRATGFIFDLSAEVVNVPLEMYSAFDGIAPYSNPKSTQSKHLEARVAFGRRLEPWLVSAATQ
jgi:hypothetical protein